MANQQMANSAPVVDLDSLRYKCNIKGQAKPMKLSGVITLALMEEKFSRKSQFSTISKLVKLDLRKLVP